MEIKIEKTRNEIINIATDEFYSNAQKADMINKWLDVFKTETEIIAQRQSQVEKMKLIDDCYSSMKRQYK
jgi:hypothetical protein